MHGNLFSCMEIISMNGNIKWIVSLCLNVKQLLLMHEALTLEEKEREIGRARAHDRSMLFTVQF